MGVEPVLVVKFLILVRLCIFVELCVMFVKTYQCSWTKKYSSKQIILDCNLQ